ncbi:hypothetical protein L1987_79065 [Smallanthus sonchifolius]|uniref:Uncharacterized protein n=1 Tax=Smallanthus sonchifolius TaxID=185202 RepID=A0ACB8ZFG5_9ASTR|nr:hypothetical protein L1987_79065 [Smallanthus sonchifolius]
MAVQAQVYSDHNQNNNNDKMGFFNLPQDWVLMPNSSVFQFGDEHKSLCSSYQQDQGFMDLGSDYRNLISTSNSRRNGMIGFQDLSSELERQRLEMNCFLHFQNEKLKTVLNEETRKREVILMQNYESKMKAIIEAKDEVLNTAKMRTKKLQNYLIMADKESKIWERKAKESEAMMIELNTVLKQARARTHEDAESICDGDDDEKERHGKTVCKDVKSNVPPYKAIKAQNKAHRVNNAFKVGETSPINTTLPRIESLLPKFQSQDLLLTAESLTLVSQILGALKIPSIGFFRSLLLSCL